MQEQAHLIGLEAVTGRTLRLQGELVVFALVCHVATGTVEVSIEHVGAGVLPIRHDEARVDALVGPLDLDDHPARARPGACWVAGRVKAGRLAPPARLGPLGLLEDLGGQPLQHRVACEACARAHVGLGCAPLHHCGIGKVTVTAQDAPSVGPRVPKPLAHPLEHCQQLCTAEALSLEDGGKETPCKAFIPVAWQETIAPILAIVADLFLCPMRAILGVIDVEHDDLGGTVVGRNTWSHSHQSHAINLGA